MLPQPCCVQCFHLLLLKLKHFPDVICESSCKVTAKSRCSGWLAVTPRCPGVWGLTSPFLREASPSFAGRGVWGFTGSSGITWIISWCVCLLEVESGQMVPVPRTAQEGKFVPWGRDSREDKQGLHSWGEAVTNHNKVLVLYPCMAFFVVVVRWMKKVKKEITSLMISFTSQSFKLTRPK